jgi:hypothetical protein
MGKLIDPKHCEGKTRFQSFPSGHTIIAFALATSLILYCEEERKLKPENDTCYRACMVSILIVAVSVSIHRVSYGYHHVSDVIVGAIIGMIIGYLCFKIVDPYINLEIDKTRYNTATYKACKTVAIGFAVVGILHFFLFKFHKLSQLQH